MRIAHYFHTLDAAQGGTFRVMANMALASAAAGHEVSVLTPSIPDKNAADVRALEEGLRVVHRPGPSGLLGKATAERFADEFTAADVVHLHSLWHAATWRIVNVCARVGTPTMLTMHGMLMDYPMRSSAAKKKVFLKTLGGSLLRRVGVVQMLNAEESRQSRGAGVDYRFVEIPNGVDVAQFASLPERGWYRSTQPALEGKTVVLSMGRLHSIKGCELLLGAFLDEAASREDIALVMAGPDEGSLPELEAMLEGHPARARVLLPGLVGGEVRLGMLSDADIFAQCSRHETASMSVLEAAYAGKPLLLTDKCNYPEFASAGTGAECPVSREGVRTALASLLDRRDDLEDMGARAKAIVDEKFRQDRVMDAIHGVYAKLIAGERFPLIQSER